MARGGFRSGAGRPKKGGATRVKTRLSSRPVKSSSDMLPLDYMLAVMRDSQADEARRDRMACAAAPFIHEKAADNKLGKKEQREEAAKQADDVFSMSRGKPKLVVDND